MPESATVDIDIITQTWMSYDYEGDFNVDTPYPEVWAGIIRELRNDEGYKQLVESIREGGQDVAATAYYDVTYQRVMFVDGHHRLAALMELGFTEIIMDFHERPFVNVDSGSWRARAARESELA